MALSKFIQSIAKKIEEVSGFVSQKSMIPTEVRYLQVEPIQGKVILRTVEETQNMDVVQLRQFDPHFQNNDTEIPCQFPGCSETRKFVQECESQEKSKKIKRDLFLCKVHRKKLTSSVLKYCRNENVTLDGETFKENDFTGYTSLIGVLEKAFMHLQSKWWKSVNDFLLAEIFLNTRNFLLIANALLNPDEDNTATVLGPYLTALLKFLDDPKKVLSGVMLLMVVMWIILTFYSIAYDWIPLFTGTPGAKAGTAVGILSGLLAVKIFNFTPAEKVFFFLSIVVAGALFGGVLNGGTDPCERQPGEGLKFARELFQDILSAVSSGILRRTFHALGDSRANFSINIPDQ